MEPTTIYILAVLFLAMFVRSTLGFAGVLISVPLLALAVPIEVAVPLAVLVSNAIALVIIVQDWRHVQFRSVGWLMLATLVGTPFGLLLVVLAAESVVKALLGAVIIAFALYCLLHRQPVELRDDRLAWCFGFGAGILGGAYGMNGPPLVVYGALRRWSPERFRATLQGYFVPAGAVTLLGYWLSGLWTPQVLHYFVLSLLPAAAALVLGKAVSQRMAGPVFAASVHVALVLVGLMLVGQAMWR